MIIFILAASFYWFRATHKTSSFASINAEVKSQPAAWLKLHGKAIAAKRFAEQQQYNSNVCFLIDMTIESGQDRFFIYDLKKDSVLDAGLVTHGRCNEEWLMGRKYSNKVGSGCTSQGRYKVGKSYNGTFGLAYKLHGLDTTNNNAFKRFVVLHSHECVPENEIDPMPLCQSDGCPTVSPGFLKKLASIIDQSAKPVLLWIYE